MRCEVLVSLLVSVVLGDIVEAAGEEKKRQTVSMSDPDVSALFGVSCMCFEFDVFNAVCCCALCLCSLLLPLSCSCPLLKIANRFLQGWSGLQPNNPSE